MKIKLSVHPKQPTTLFERVYRKAIFTPKDMGAIELDAFTYGILVGYEDQEVIEELQHDFNWSDEDMKALSELHEKYLELQNKTWK